MKLSKSQFNAAEKEIRHLSQEVAHLKSENEKLRATIDSAHEWVIAASNNENSILRKANILMALQYLAPYAALAGEKNDT
jgi:septal ring factor EnvC (AmiA/AmiB activator)